MDGAGRLLARDDLGGTDLRRCSHVKRINGFQSEL